MLSSSSPLQIDEPLSINRDPPYVHLEIYLCLQMQRSHRMCLDTRYLNCWCSFLECLYTSSLGFSSLSHVCYDSVSILSFFFLPLSCISPVRDKSLCLSQLLSISIFFLSNSPSQECVCFSILLFQKGWLAAASRRYSEAFDVCRFLPVYTEAMGKKKKMNPQLLHPTISRTASPTQQKQSSLSPPTRRQLEGSEEKKREEEKEQEDKQAGAQRAKRASIPTPSQAGQDKQTGSTSADVNSYSSSSGRSRDSRLALSSSVAPRRVETTAYGGGGEEEERDNQIGLIELSKTACSLLNNLALCCLKQSQWRDALKHAETSLLLIDVAQQEEEKEEDDDSREDEEGREEEEEKIEEREQQMSKARMDGRMKGRQEEEKEKGEVMRRDDTSQGRRRYERKNADSRIERREISQPEQSTTPECEKKKNSLSKKNNERKKKKNSRSPELCQGYEDLRCVALYRKARALETGGEIQKAIDACREALNIHPADSHLRVSS